jgi:hypothetical protein
MLLSSGRDHRALRRPLFRRPLRQAVEDALVQGRVDQGQHLPVRHLPGDQRRQAVVRDRVEVALQVGIDDVGVTGLEQPVHPPQRVFTSPSGARAVALRGEVALEDRFQ